MESLYISTHAEQTGKYIPSTYDFIADRLQKICCSHSTVVGVRNFRTYRYLHVECSVTPHGACWCSNKTESLPDARRLQNQEGKLADACPKSVILER